MMLNGKIRSTPRPRAAAGRAGHLARDRERIGLMCRILGLVALLRRGDRAQNAELLLPRHENAVLRRQAGRVRSEPESGSAAQLEDVRGDVDVILQALSPARPR